MQTDAASHNNIGPNNVGTCCVVHANERNNCQHCCRKLIILALITALSVPSFYSVYRSSHVFSSKNSFYFTRPRGKSFPRGQSAVPSRSLTIFWCISRFSIFCLNVSCFLKFFAQFSLIRHVYNNPERRKRATIVCFLKKYYKARAQTFSRGQHCWGSMQTDATLLRYASPVTEQ